MRPLFKIFVILTSLSFTPPAFTAIASGGLSAFPKRVEFSSHQKNSVLNLTNNGNKTTKYRIQLVDFIHDKKGNLQAIPTTKLPPNYHSAKKIVRYSPRQITIRPGESQAIRLLVRRSRNLAEGEYRSFIYFQALPDKQKTANNIQTLTQSDTDSVHITPIVLQSLALPIVVQQGKLSANAQIKTLTLIREDPKNPSIKLHLSRSGNRSLYGEVEIKQGDKTVGLAKGLTLYNPYKERTFNVPLDADKLQSGEILTVTYRGLDRDAGTTFATGEIIVP
ncbi:MAG: hypothetical protein Q9O24_06470 [Gammaproteobacteria bacterium]|nr:hypothetical protein [Gammaproteobacteria bacterium]